MTDPEVDLSLFCVSQWSVDNEQDADAIRRGTEEVRRMAMEALDAGDATGFLGRADNMLGLRIVEANVVPLQHRGIYEKALLTALLSPRGNNSRFSLGRLHRLVALADRSRLLNAGELVPGFGPFTLYRGVSGKGSARRIRGYSWTADLDTACWFGCRPVYSAGSPAVFRGEFKLEDVLAYSNERKEQEFLVDMPKGARIERPLSVDEVRARYSEYQRRLEELQGTWIAEQRKKQLSGKRDQEGGES
jgi:hypothetical protein